MTDPICAFDYIMLGAVIGFAFGAFYTKYLLDKRLEKVGLSWEQVAPTHTCPVHGKERCRCDLFSDNHTCPESQSGWQRFWDLQGKVHWKETTDQESKQWWKDQPPSGVA
jgi:hypothetical protein